MSQPVLDTIRQFLREHDVDFREMHHEPTFTSEQSAAARGESLEIGGKALLIKVGEEFRLFVMPAHRQLDSKKIRAYFDVRKTRFASRDELKEMTGLVPGCVPPFGRPILDFSLFVDEAITANDRIAFNAGSLEDSMIIPLNDYLRVAQPQGTFAFSIVEGEQ